MILEPQKIKSDTVSTVSPSISHEVMGPDAIIRGNWNAKVGSQETPGVKGKFGLGIQNEAGQRLIVFCQENALVIANTLFQQHKRRTHGHHQMVNTEIRLIIFFAAKDGGALYSQQNQDQELIGSDHELLIAKFRLKLKKEEKPLGHSGMT